MLARRTIGGTWRWTNTIFTLQLGTSAVVFARMNILALVTFGFRVFFAFSLAFLNSAATVPDYRDFFFAIGTRQIGRLSLARLRLTTGIYQTAAVAVCFHQLVAGGASRNRQVCWARNR